MTIKYSKPLESLDVKYCLELSKVSQDSVYGNMLDLSSSDYHFVPCIIEHVMFCASSFHFSLSSSLVLETCIVLVLPANYKI